MDWMRIFIVIVLLLIIGSLATAFVSLIRGSGSDRTLRFLTIRVGLSVALFLFLIAGLHFGFITPGRSL